MMHAPQVAGRVVLLSLLFTALFSSTSAAQEPRLENGLAVVIDPSTLDRSAAVGAGQLVELSIVLTDLPQPGINAVQYGLEIDPRLTVLSTAYAPESTLQLEVEPGEFIVGFQGCVSPAVTPYVVATITVLTPADETMLDDLVVSPRALNAYGEPMLVNNCADSRISAPVVDMGGVRLNPTGPGIPFFASTAPVVVEGRDYTLGWSTVLGTSVLLDGTAVGPAGTSPRTATAPTSHVLTVDGVVSRAVDVDVIREPRIVSFEAAVATELTPPRTGLSWEVVGATTVEIEGFGVQPARGGLLVDYEEGRTYTLRASNEFGVSTATALAGDPADVPPAVFSFTATPTVYGEGEPVVLAWRNFAADTATIQPDVGPVDPSSGSVEVFPVGTVTYTLTLTNAFGSVSQSVTVEPAPPRIDSFSVSPTTILQGEAIDVSWATRFADTVRLEPDGIDLPATGSLALTPAESTVYRLVASNAYGTVEASRAVGVTLPEITLFEVSPDSIFPGEKVIARWQTTPGLALRIEPDVGAVEGAVGFTDVFPSADGIVYALIGSVAGQDVVRAEAGPVRWKLPEVTLQLASSQVVPNEGFSMRVLCEGCDQLEVQPDPGSFNFFGDVPAVTEFGTRVDSTTIYVATATNARGSTVDSLRIDPEPLAPVVSLQVEAVSESGVVFPGDRVRVSGSVRYAAFATLVPGRATGLPNGDFDFLYTLEGATTFTLFAENAFGSQTRTAEVVPLPPVVSLTGPELVLPGEPFELVLEVDGEDEVFLEPGFGAVPGSGTYTTSVDADTTFTARAVNAVGASTATWAVTLSAPIVDLFAAVPRQIVQGQSSTLSWSTRGAQRIDILSGGVAIAEDVLAESSLDVTPLTATDYVLRARNDVGVVDDSVRVDVASIAIRSFTAAPSTVPRGGVTTLSWVVEGEGEVELLDFGVVPLTGSREVMIDETRDFTLVARNAGVEVDRRTLTVPVSNAGANVVRWSWSETGDDSNPPPLQPAVPFEAWVVAEEAEGGMLAFQFRAIVPPEVFILSAGPPQPTGVVITGHPEWVVGTGFCLFADVVPLLRYEFLALNVPDGWLDIGNVQTNPSLPDGEPAFSNCANQVSALFPGAPLRLDGYPVAAVTVDLRATAGGGGVQLQWAVDGIDCAERVHVFRAAGGGAIERVAELRDLDACGAWTDGAAPADLDDVRYRVTVETASGALVSPEVTVDAAPAPDRGSLRARLLENVPNPFNPATELRFALPRAGRVELTVFDTAGRLVRSFDLGRRPAGEGRVTWTGTDAAGRAVGSGVYLVRLDTQDGVDTRRILLVK